MGLEPEEFQTKSWGGTVKSTREGIPSPWIGEAGPTITPVKPEPTPKIVYLPSPTPAATKVSTNGYGTLSEESGTQTGIWEGITGFFKGLFNFGGEGDSSALLEMMMLMSMFSGKGGFNSNMLMMLMMMQSMPSGGILGNSNPIMAMLLPRMGTTKAMLLGGPELALGQMLFKPKPRYRRRRVVYRYPRRRYYRRYY